MWGREEWKVDAANHFGTADPLTAKHREALAPREVGLGILAVHRNARRLFLDAMLLLEHGRYPSAVLMGVLAHEEIAKAFTLAMIGGFLPLPPSVKVEKGKVFQRLLWREFEDHERKNRLSLDLYAHIADLPPEARKTLQAMDRQAMAKAYVRIRERSTYVDCVQGDARWSIPEAVATAEMAVQILGAIREAVGRIVVPTDAVEVAAANPMASAERRAAVREWSESGEAQEVSRIDLEEHRSWAAQVDARLAKVVDALRAEGTS